MMSAHETSTPARLNGRRAQAARNDQRVLEAARAVFTADPDAPIAAVAERAGVGISVLYRRYRSKEEMLQRLSAEGLSRYIADAEAALVAMDAGDDPWTAFAAFMRHSLDEGAGSLSVRFAGRFTATDEQYRLGRDAHAKTQRLLDRTQAAGALRGDIVVGDVSLILEQLQSVRAGDERRTKELRHRYLTLLLDALHNTSAVPLPGPPPAWEEIGRRYET